MDERQIPAWFTTHSYDRIPERESILKLEGNLRSEKSNNGFILLMAALSNCIEYLSYKLGVTFYDLVNLCSVEIWKGLFT
ncbi:hypothetical protein [Archaeoglobus sp.]